MRRGRIFFYLAFIMLLGLVAVVFVWKRFLQPPADTLAQGEPAPRAQTVEMTNIVVVAQRVPRGAVIDESLLQLVNYPREQMLPGMYSDMNQVVGRMAKFDLDAGIPLTSGMLVDNAESLSAAGSTAALAIPRGMVAVSVPISRLASVSYAPQTGDHVNVIASLLFLELDTDYQARLPNKTVGVIAPGTGTLSGATTGVDFNANAAEAPSGPTPSGTNMEVESSSITAISGGGGAPAGRAEIDPILGQTFYMIPSEAQRPRMVSQALLQDVVVLRMGTFPLEEEEKQQNQQDQAAQGLGVEGQDIISETTQNPEEQKEPEKPDTVTLIVSPQDAVTLNYLLYHNAELTLALRGAGDDTRVETEPVTLQFLMDQYNIPVPVKLPYGLEPRVDQISEPEMINDQVVEEDNR